MHSYIITYYHVLQKLPISPLTLLQMLERNACALELMVFKFGKLGYQKVSSNKMTFYNTHVSCEGFHEPPTLEDQVPQPYHEVCTVWHLE